MFSDLFAYNHTIHCYKAYYVLGPHSKKVIQELIWGYLFMVYKQTFNSVCPGMWYLPELVFFCCIEIPMTWNPLKIIWNFKFCCCQIIGHRFFFNWLSIPSLQYRQFFIEKLLLLPLFFFYSRGVNLLHVFRNFQLTWCQLRWMFKHCHSELNWASRNHFCISH
jgi:hypothetical protein